MVAGGGGVEVTHEILSYRITYKQEMHNITPNLCTCRESAHTSQTLDPVLHLTLTATLKVVVS